MIEAIDRYIHNNSVYAIRIKGINLYNAGKVLNLSYDVSQGSGTAMVKGTYNYLVNIEYNHSLDEITTNCSCPYDWGGICKHVIAALFTLKNRTDVMAGHDQQLKLFSTDASKKDYPGLPLIKEFREITKSTVILLTHPRVLKSRMYPEYNVSVQTFKKYKTLQFRLAYDEYSYDTYFVDFQRKDEGVEVSCTCGTCYDKLCLHGYILLNSFVHQAPKLLSLLDEAGYKNHLCDQLRMFGIDTIEPENYVELGIEDGKFALNFKPEYEGLMVVDKKGHQLITDKIEKHLKMVADPAFYLDLNENDDSLTSGKWGFGINFSLSPYDQYVYELTCLSAKYNKAQTFLHSHFTALSPEDLDALDEHQRNIMITSIQLNKQLPGYFDDEELQKLRYYRQIIPILKSLFEQIRAYDFAYVSFSESILMSQYKNKIVKSELNPVSISRNYASLHFRLMHDDNFIELQAFLHLDGAEIPLSDIRKKNCFFGGLLLIFNNTLYLLPDLATYIAINACNSGSYKTVIGRKDAFLDQMILPLSVNFNIDMSKATAYKTTVQNPNPQKRLIYISDMGDFVIFRPIVKYSGEHEQNILNGGERIVRANGQITRYARHREYEKDFNEIIKGLHPKFKRQFPEEFYHLKIDDMLEDTWFLEAFEILNKAEIEVLGLEKLKKLKYSYFKPSITSHLKSGQDWFEIEILIAFGDNQVSLAQVKKALIKKQNFVTLADGKIGLLPLDWLNRFAKLFRYGEVKGDEIKISNMKFMIIEELFREISNTQIVMELREKKEKLASFSSIKNIRKPKGIKADLRDYQKEGLNWLNFLNEFGWGGILADDMGLGKTLQILSFLVQQKSKTRRSNLIVVPTSLIFNWENEINKFCPDMDVYFYYGSNREKDHKPFSEYDLVITSYGLLVNDIEILRQYAFNYVILDESQSIKNTQSLRFKAACLLKAKHRIAMTGTPIENNTFDLYAQMHFVNPGLLGSAAGFKEKYSTPIDKEGDQEIATELKKIIHPFIIRRTKEQVAKELPPKTEEVIYCKMEPDQRKVYDAYRNKYREALLGRIEEDGLEKSKIYILEGLTKLRQICDSPVILSDEEDYGAESVKIRELMRNIKEKTGNHKIVVFSQFVSMLKLIANALVTEHIEYEYLDGKSSKTQREESVMHFQTNDRCRVFLISLKAGGTGLNLTAADYVFLVDPWWNPAVENQAIDRCYRIGQDKKVFAYRMICKDTVEEKIVQYQQKKQAVAADIIQAEESFMKQLSAEDIKGLFD